ncbi:hypothetical protein AMTRI_Chr13g84780 [Amborella trichopoda]
MEASKLEHEVAGAHDALRFGLPGVKSDITISHPLQSIQVSVFQRLPGPLPSSMLGLEALTGELDDIGFEDYLNDPRDSESFRPVDMHNGMEVRLGLAKGPICPSFI